MFKRSFINPRLSPTRLLLTIAVMACLSGLAISLSRRTVPAASSVVGATSITQNSSAKRDSPPQLSGEKAREYLERTGEGQSLMGAVTAARLGLKWQERAPFSGASGGGYLGMSHDQNLNAWFDEEGATIRPTVPEKERAQAWQLGLRLKAYGYGAQMQAAPPIVARNVKENRIEYEREDFELRIANCEFKKGSLFNPQSAIRNPQFVEWYENRAEGIEQGFTINERPVRSVEVAANEPLRMLLGVSGDLRAHAVNEGQQIELVDAKGKDTLSYSKLTAQDADRKQLAARMEASADGREIALWVDDAGARYPIVIDPIVATLEKKLDAGAQREVDARFGFAVAIDGDRAVVGAWREGADGGGVYFLTRTGSSWSNTGSLNYAGGYNCGYSVAISGSRVVFGCPGANSNTGRAFIDDHVAGRFNELIPAPGGWNAGNRYGTSVAISGGNILVGAPGFDISSSFQNTGDVVVFRPDSNGNFFYITDIQGDFNFGSDAQSGTSVAIDGDTIVVGIPGTGAGRAQVYTLASSGLVTFRATLQPNDGAPGDLFGQSVAISGNTAVISAAGNDEKGTNAGAAYVFVRDSNGTWSQQQKLTGSDSTVDDGFGASRIQGNTIIVGAPGWEFDPRGSPDDDNGKAYIFTRSGTVWTEQTTMVGDNNVGDNFGVGVGISGNTVIVGARTATASGIARAGAAYVYRLDCVPPYGVHIATSDSTDTTNKAACPGEMFYLRVYNSTTPTGGTVSIQWRKNGVNIPGATSNVYGIDNASASDAGSYDVIMSNSCGSDTSNVLTLTVHTFSLNPTSQNFGAAGSTGIVNVSSVAADSDLNSAEFNRAFVLMQFFGYLRRNPNDPQDTDYTGYDFWLTKLSQFNGNFVNADMVKAFITSGEYRSRFGP